MGLDDYKVVLYRNQPSGWVAEIPAIPGCHALMPSREEALAELAGVFELIAEEYRDRDLVAPRLPRRTAPCGHGSDSDVC